MLRRIDGSYLAFDAMREEFSIFDLQVPCGGFVGGGVDENSSPQLLMFKKVAI